MSIVAVFSLLFLAACASAPPTQPGGFRVSSIGGELYARRWGDDARPDILLIHGSTSHSGEFNVSLGPALDDAYTLVAYDRPGMGRSRRRPADAADLGVQAQAAADVIRAAGLVRPVVVAHSYGGAVALRLALDHPDLISGLVLLAPASHPWDGGVPFFFQIQAAPVVGEVVSTLAWPFSGGFARGSLAARVFSPLQPPEGYFEATETYLALRPAQMRASARDFMQLLPGLHAQSGRYRTIAMPVAVIAGREDRVAPIAEKADPDNPAFPLQHLVILDGVGHMPHHARPDVVADEVAWVLRAARDPATLQSAR